MAHEVNPHTNQQQHRPPTDQERHEQGALLTRFDVKLHAVVNKVADQATIEIGCRGSHATLIGGDSHNLSGTALTFLNYRALYVLVANLFQEVGIAKRDRAAGAVRVKLLEDGKKYQADDQPDCNFGKPLIVQAKLQLGRGRKSPLPHASHFRHFKRDLIGICA